MRIKIGFAIAAFLIISAITVTLFAHWEPSGETWGYWLFARVFAETGKFIIMDRGPLYTLYLSLFRFIHYPYSVTVEYFVTSLIVAVSLVIFFRRHLGIAWSVFAVLLWLPFLQVAEPPVQKLALVFTCLALMVRDNKIEKFRLSASYALMLLAYMVRSTYIVFILAFVAWDCIRIFGRKKPKDTFISAHSGLSYLPIILALILLIWFKAMESPHPWNNVFYGDTSWFACDGKKQGDSAFIHNYNWQYIFHKYGTFKGKDFYFTNRELFNGAHDILGAIRANPGFVTEQIIRNIKTTVFSVVNFTLLYRVVGGNIILGVFFMISVLYGAFQECKNNKDEMVFIIANIFVLGTAIIALPKGRYFIPFVPILIFSASWYGKRIASWRVFRLIGFFIIPLVLIVFSNCAVIWKDRIKNIASDIRTHDIRVLESRPYSFKASFKAIEPLILNCRGVMSFEAVFFGAFTNIPLSKNYDVWEIPPFGRLGDSAYKGLNPERVDCILISHELATGVGAGMNYQDRYENYIKPYTKELEAEGAKLYDIKEFGQVIILQRTDPAA